MDKELLKTILEDDETSNGGVSFQGETLKDFLDSLCMPYNTPLKDINRILKECGIKQIGQKNE